MKSFTALLSIILFTASCHTHKVSKSIVKLDSDDYFGNYSIKNSPNGTQTNVRLEGGYRVIETNAIPNHETGAFPNQGNPNSIQAQKRRYSLPINPSYTGSPKRVRETGVAINGVKFEPGTAEVIRCESGETYRVEAIQNVFDLGLDLNLAHVQPTGAYHYHGVPKGLVNDPDNEDDLVHVGFALDGFPIYYSKTGVYKSSYQLVENSRSGENCAYTNPHSSREVEMANSIPDGTYTQDFKFVAGFGDLDECNGIEVDGKYRYMITDEFPYISRCLMGEFEEERRPPRGPRPPRGRRGGERPRN